MHGLMTDEEYAEFKRHSELADKWTERITMKVNGNPSLLVALFCRFMSSRYIKKMNAYNDEHRRRSEEKYGR